MSFRRERIYDLGAYASERDPAIFARKNAALHEQGGVLDYGLGAATAAGGCIPGGIAASTGFSLTTGAG